MDILKYFTEEFTNRSKKILTDNLVGIYLHGSAKGIEMSIVKSDVCKPFVYPTPFELHFSVMHVNWYRDNPDDYIQKMNGTDEDLAAHFTIIRNRGICLEGLPIKDVFGEVPREAYLDLIWQDIAEGEEDIKEKRL